MAILNGMVRQDMEIITLIKANICRKKGSFIGITLLMVIISMSLTAIISVQDNCRDGLKAAYEQTDAADVTFSIKKQDLSADMLSSLKEHPLIGRIRVFDAIQATEIKCGGITEQTGWELLKYRKEFKIVNDAMNAYQKEPATALKNGEIYITQGTMTRMKCQIGDSLRFFISGREYSFQVKGIVVEPMFGSSTIGWKQIFINDEDFEKLRADEDAQKREGKTALYSMVSLYKAAGCALTDGKFKRRINLDTGIIDRASVSLTKEMSEHYTNLFMEIIFAILLVFILFLFLVVLITMAHSIGVGIEMDYTNIGILKSQGFSKNKIRAVWILQYLLAQAAGAFAGMVLSIPLCNVLGGLFWPITGILANKNISAAKSLFLISVILLISAFLILMLTRKIARISPIRAISGGRSEIYFDSGFQMPIFRNWLSASLALRQFTSNRRKYVGTIVIVSILIFFMLTVTLIGNVLNSKTAIQSMGGLYVECAMDFTEKVNDKQLANIEKTIEKYSKIKKKYYLTRRYLSVNGEEIYCQIYQNPEVVPVLNGRAPLYENEIVVTEIIADELDLKIGDKVLVTHGVSKKEFIVSGLFQSINDTGLTFVMPLKGAKIFGVESVDYAGYSLDSPQSSAKITAELNNIYDGILKAKSTEGGGIMEDTYTIAINCMKAVIYIFSVLFALVVVVMVCNKTFIQERNDIGIYKALGFTAVNLRIQFAVRFFVVALAGSLLGSILSIYFSGRLLNTLLRNMGITSFAVQFTPITFFVPIMSICLCFLLFAYLAARKVKKVEARELVME